ncbi:MAG: hypothetical protein QOH67_4203 [Hyphomicrobiales bacterium]|jgi:hypothetical protein|nr:hypothetical protein [Hyphomicrobiales bacterium]
MAATINVPDPTKPEQFEIVLESNGTAEEQKLKERFDGLRTELTANAAATEYARLLQRLQNAARLAFTGVNGGAANPNLALESLGAIRADYERLKARPGRFKVDLPPELIHVASPRDIIFRLDDRPGAVPAEQLKLKTDIEETLTTLQVIFPERQASGSIFWKWLKSGFVDSPDPIQGGSSQARVTAGVTVPHDSDVGRPVRPPPEPGAGSAAKTQDQRRFQEYQLKLWSLAQVGLQGEASPDTARLALTALQNEILRQEGPRIKNTYMTRLGLFAFAFAAAAAIAYLAIRNNDGFSVQLFAMKNLFLLWTGTMIGTWLSFGIRKPVITLADLGGLESDMVEPPLRLLFTGLIAITFGFIFMSGMVNVKIGTLDTVQLLNHGSIALAIGMLFGVSEQLLPGALTRRSSQFLSEVGGK